MRFARRWPVDVFRWFQKLQACLKLFSLLAGLQGRWIPIQLMRLFGMLYENLNDQECQSKSQDRFRKDIHTNGAAENCFFSSKTLPELSC